MQFSWFSTCLVCRPPWAPSPISHKPSMVSHGCNPRTWEVKTELEAPGYPQLHIQFKTSLGFIRSHLKKEKTKQKKQNTCICHWKHLSTFFFLNSKPMYGARLVHLKSQSSYINGWFYCIFKGITTNNLRHPKERISMKDYLRFFRSL